MAAIQSRPAKPGNVVKYEFLREHGYEREPVTVLFAAGMGVGAVVKNDGDGTYSWVAAADIAALNPDVGVVVDAGIYDSDVVGDREVVVLLGGPGASGAAVVVKEGLTYADALSGAQRATVQTAIEAKGIKVGTRV